MPETGSNIRSSQKILSIRLCPGGLSFWTGAVSGIGGGKHGEPGGLLPLEPMYKGLEPETVVAFPRREVSEEALDVAVKRIAGLVPGYAALPKLVFVDMPKTVLVPAEVFDPAKAAEYLRLHNMEPEGGEELCAGAEIHGTVAVMAAPAEPLGWLRERIGEFVVASPVQFGLMCPPPEIRVKGLGTGCYVTLHNTMSGCAMSLFSVDAGRREMLWCDSLPRTGDADLLYYLGVLSEKYPVGRKTPVLVSGYGAEATCRALKRYYKVL